MLIFLFLFFFKCFYLSIVFGISAACLGNRPAQPDIPFRSAFTCLYLFSVFSFIKNHFIFKIETVSPFQLYFELKKTSNTYFFPFPVFGVPLYNWTQFPHGLVFTRCQRRRIILFLHILISSQSPINTPAACFHRV